MSDSDSKPGEQIDEGRGRKFPCEGCGADLEFSIGQQDLKCPYCGFEKQLEFAEDATVAEQDFHAMLGRICDLRSRDRETAGDQSELRCDACGGTVVFQGSLTSSECPYCASPVQLENVHDATDRIPVDGVLPFLVEKQSAQTNLARWVQSRWFAPNDFKQRGVTGKFNGIYTPFWTYDSMTFTRYRGQRGEHYWETVRQGDKEHRVMKTRWYPASGAFDRFFDDVLVLASRGLPRTLMDRLEPWPLHRCVPFTQQALAGFFARTYETELDEGFNEARQHIETALDREVRQRIGGDTQRVHSVDTQYSAITFKHLLLPVWLLAYRYNGKTFQIVVNAATGEVQGERPWSWVKILFAVLGGLAIAGTVFALSQR
ncbi:hypothetical protein GC176_01620 [bacterium]|nr:hypothetical protein [bacterium]